MESRDRLNYLVKGESDLRLTGDDLLDTLMSFIEDITHFRAQWLRTGRIPDAVEAIRANRTPNLAQ